MRFMHYLVYNGWGSWIRTNEVTESEANLALKKPFILAGFSDLSPKNHQEIISIITHFLW